MEIEVIKKLIKDNIVNHTNLVNKSFIAERYYKNKNDIMYSNKNDKEENPLRNADNRISSNFHGLLVNQKASYMFTAPPLFDIGNSTGNKRIIEVLGDKYPKTCKDLCINAANSGIAWLHYWINEEGNFEYGVVDSKQIIPIWSSGLNKRLIAVFRTYDELGEDGEVYNVYEYWTDEECHSFRKLSSKSIDEDFQVYTLMNMDASQISEGYNHDLGRVPFIPFLNNNVMTSDLDNVKPLIDVYDKVFSGFVNDLEDIQEIIFILSGYEGENLGEFLTQLKKYKTIKLDSTGEDKSGLSTLTIDIPIEARKELLTTTRKAIFEQGQGVDPQPEQFGNASGVALKFMYSLLELKVGLAETEFKLGFGELIRAICSYLNIECKSIIQTWTRTAISNDVELSDICSSSVGVISNKTIRKNHPFVEDENAEEKQMEKEKEESPQYPNFPLKDDTKGDVDEE